METNEESELWRKFDEEKREKHREWKRLNTELLKESGIIFGVASEECYIFREKGKPKVDFYPSTGRWRELSSGRTFRGGAKAFICWYKKL